MSDRKSYKILGIGSAFVDHIIRVDEEYVHSLEGGKGGMVVINYHTMNAILDKFGGEATLIAGGSCSNALRGLAKLGNSCAIWSKVGRDVAGETYVESLKSAGVHPILHYTHTPTAHSLCLVTPDGERTMRSYLGASQEMDIEQLDPADFEGIKLLHIEGYALLKEGLPERAAEMAKEAGALVSIDLASYEIVEKFKGRIESLLKGLVDIVIANADEGWALKGLPPRECCQELKEWCKVAILLFGEGGCWVGSEGTLLHGAPFPIEPVDTTGAGDLFASGFLHGYLQGWPLEECALLGNRTGSAVVQVLGAEISPVGWKLVKTHMQSRLGGERCHSS